MPPWNKGLTKETNESVRRISETMKSRKINNFKNWMEEMKLIGKIPDSYPAIRRSGNLAEYVGVVLGDGNIGKFPRTERIIIVSNANNLGFVNRYSKLTKLLFRKKPTVSRSNINNSIRISLYQKFISKRLNIPTGSKKFIKFRTPIWITRNNAHLIRFLRGLFEAEGSYSIHKKTYTYNFQFSNTNESLLVAVKNGLIKLGFHPEIRKTSIRLRRRQEVEKFLKMSRFRRY